MKSSWDQQSLQNRSCPATIMPQPGQRGGNRRWTSAVAARRAVLAAMPSGETAAASVIRTCGAAMAKAQARDA